MYFYLNKKGRLAVAVTIVLAGVFMTSSFVYAAGEAALFLNPATGSLLVGSTFDVSIILDTKGKAINTIEVELTFPADKIQIANPSIGRSIVQVWTAPPTFSNRQGRMYFVAGIPSPGINISDGVILTTTFRVVAPGEGEIRFGERVSVLANDGRGTDVLGQKTSAFFKFLIPPPQGPAISSPTHSDQERWYRDTNPFFIWAKTPFADGYSYSIDHNPSGFPDTVSDGTVTTSSFQNLDNGVWYFHLRERAGGVWGGVSHYAVQIDDELPAAFKINVSPSKRTTNRNPIFRFFTTDALSGFDHFEMKIISLSQKTVTESFFFEVTSPYQAPNFKPGRYQVIVRALDKAGNSQDRVVTMNIVGLFYQFLSPEGVDFVIFFVPWAWIADIMLFLVLIFLITLVLLWHRHRAHLGHVLREDLKGAVNFFKKR